MSNQRDPNKKKVNIWMTSEEKAMLLKAAKDHGFTNVTDFVKAVARGAIRVVPAIMALCVAWNN
jgi:uncharacterized protein (DUF1778 family)